MSQTNGERRGLRAMGSICNGTISASEGRWFAKQLRENQSMRELYVDYMTMHGCLASEASALAALDADEPSTSTPAPKSSTHKSSSQRLASLAGKTWPFLAASLVCVALFFVLSNQGLLTRSGRLAGNGDAANHVVAIARVTSTQNCRWGEMSEDVGYGSELVAGQTIRLREGLAEITFEDGATMLLESPATVVIKSASEVDIREGRLAARVPPGSNNFYVNTKTLNLSNVGAEFGLLARETGTSELHVFNGTVSADVLNTAGERRRSLELIGSQAVFASPLSTTVFEFPADETHFVRSMVPTPGPNDGLLAYEGFVYPEGPLPAQNGGFGWAGPWFSLDADNVAGPDSNSVSARSLAVSGVVPRGNHAAIVAQHNRIRRSLASSVGGVFDVAGLVEDHNGVRLIGQDGTVVYLSFLQRVDAVDDGFYGLELHRGDGNANRVLCIGNGADNTGYGVTSAVNVYGIQNFPSLGQENTEVNFVVVKISFGAGGRDTVEVFRNPASLNDEQQCQADAVLKGNFAFDRISLANFDGSKSHEIDELRIGTHFMAVTGRGSGERGRLIRRITEHSISDDAKVPLCGISVFASNSHNPLMLEMLYQ